MEKQYYSIYSLGPNFYIIVISFYFFLFFPPLSIYNGEWWLLYVQGVSDTYLMNNLYNWSSFV